jgi:hypothetical protein
MILRKQTISRCLAFDDLSTSLLGKKRKNDYARQDAEGITTYPFVKVVPIFVDYWLVIVSAWTPSHVLHYCQRE